MYFLFPDECFRSPLARCAEELNLYKIRDALLEEESK